MEDSFKSDGVTSTNISSSILEDEPNPNQNLGSILLNEFNYLLWLRAMTIALDRRSKLGYVNGYIKPLNPSSQAYQAWQCKDQLVMSWLLSSMENHIAEIFSYSESSLGLWEAVKEMYGNRNNTVVFFKLQQIFLICCKTTKLMFRCLGF
jgi:hypothetical protein